MSAQRRSSRATVQAGNVSFELHTLGWEAFQNLCAHVAREVLGQTVTTFSPSNDAGQDGAFQGEWRRNKQETFAGRFVIQCKFTSRRDEHLALSTLKEELVKAQKLAQSGLAQTYLLMTNAKVSGEADRTIREAFLKLMGIEHFDLLGSEWITQQILESKRLRAFVPRTYGLGDLSQILDERVYQQADEILQTWRDNLAKFVPTEAHLKSVQALLNEGFVLLLGDPMAGKSTIAAALALAAADQWNCLPVFVSHPNDFREHWNPNEPKQLFWVDDAFGQTQLDSSLCEGWNRTFPHLAAAIRKGARVLFTSRTYIYQAAQHQIKQSAFPLLANSRVLIEVEKLTIIEKERILYNHLRLGSQPTSFRSAIKPFLPSIAANPRFFPEVAKRLGDPFFTKALTAHPDHLRKFVEEPKEFLSEIIAQLDRKNFAAMALLFMRAGRVSVPLKIRPEEMEAMAQLGADLAQVREALLSLEGSLVAQMFEAGERAWKFRHPSIRDAMASHVATRPDLMDIYIGGARVAEILREVVCGDLEVAGAKVHVPSSRFSAIFSKLRDVDVTDWNLRHAMLSFLGSRCSSAFLVTWMKECPEDFERLVEESSVVSYNFCFLFARLQRLGCLPEHHRKAYVANATQKAIDSVESTFLEEGLRELFTTEELETALGRIKDELVPELETMVADLENAYSDSDEEPSDYFQEFASSLENFRLVMEDQELIEAFEEAEALVAQAIRDLERSNRKRLEEKNRRIEEEMLLSREMERRAEWGESYQRERMKSAVREESILPQSSVVVPPRSIFDDVDM